MSDERTTKADQEIERVIDRLFNAWEVPEADRDRLYSPLLTLLAFFKVGAYDRLDRLMTVYAIDGRLSVEIRGADGDLLVRREFRPDR